MKNLYRFAVLLVVSLVALSCNEDETPAQGVEGTWELIEMRSHWTRDVVTGEDLNKETYTFHSNGTFTKTRLGAEFDFTGSGTYTITESDPTVEGNDKLKLIMDLKFEENVTTDLIYGCNILHENHRDGEDILSERLYLRDDGLLRNWGCYRIADINWYVYSR